MWPVAALFGKQTLVCCSFTWFFFSLHAQWPTVEEISTECKKVNICIRFGVFLLHFVVGLKSLCHFPNQWEVKAKPIVALLHMFTCVQYLLHAFTLFTSDWFRLFIASVFVGQSNCYSCFGFITLNWKLLCLPKWMHPFI